MRVFITKEIGSTSEKFVFSSEIWEGNCDLAKEIAVIGNAVFELEISEPKEPNALKQRIIGLNTLMDFLKVDEDTKQLFQDCYDPNKTNEPIQLSVATLSVSSSGRVKVFISSPEVDSGLDLLPNSESLEVGLALTFQSGITFSKDEMNCKEAE